MHSSALCPSCGGVWPPSDLWHRCPPQDPPSAGAERNWRWVEGDEFTELCKTTDCKATDATHYHRPVALEVPTASVDGGTAPFTAQSGTQRHCIICQQPSGAFLTVVPVCDVHSRTDSLVAEVVRLRAEIDVIQDGYARLRREVRAFLWREGISSNPAISDMEIIFGLAEVTRAKAAGS